MERESISTEFLLALLLKFENNNLCPMCNNKGPAREARDCPMCNAIIEQRMKMHNSTKVQWE